MENNELKQSIFKKAKREDKYAQISNDLINNRNLSYKAMGILVYILSKPDDWQVYISDLVREGKDGETSVRNGIKELIEHKYMQRYRVYDKCTGKVHHWETLVSETAFHDDELISSIKETYLKDDEGNIRYQKIKLGTFERLIPIVIEREVILDCEKPKVEKKTDKLLDRENLKVEKLQVGNQGQQILIPINTDSNKNLTSSSSTSKGEINLYEEFEKNICKLKDTTKIKFKKIVEKNAKDMILAVIEECTSTNTHSYSGFESAFNSYLDRNCKTREDVIVAAAAYREKNKRKSPKDNAKKSKKEKGFNNFDPRLKSERYEYLQEQCLLGQATEEEKMEFDKLRGED